MSKQSLGYKLLAGLIAATMLLTGCSASRSGDITCDEFSDMPLEKQMKVAAKVMKLGDGKPTKTKLKGAVYKLSFFCGYSQDPESKLREVVELMERMEQ